MLLILSKYTSGQSASPSNILWPFLSFGIFVGLCRSVVSNTGNITPAVSSAASSKENIEAIKAKAEAAARSASAMVIELEKALDSKCMRLYTYFSIDYAGEF